MSLCILAKPMSYGHFPLLSTDCATNKKYLSLIGQLEQFIKAKLCLQQTVVDASTRIRACQFDI